MADRRRRRRNSSNTESEYSEGEDTAELKDGKPIKKESECDSEVTQGEDDTSEYDSTTEGYDEDETEEDDDEVTEEIEDDEDVIVEDGVDWIEGERQRGDGEEEPNDGKNLDDDEDKKNPAYIPRKGAFYEHDTRLGDDVKEEKEEIIPKKKLWTDVGKWDHDRYNPDQQGPKSREEIIAIYGYDIRSREKPPDSFPRGTKSQRRRPERRKKLGDFISPGEEKSYDRTYRGRGGRGGSWRGSPRGRRWQPSRRLMVESNNERSSHSYTDFKNARNEAAKYSADAYKADSRPRSGGGISSVHDQTGATDQRTSGDRMNAGSEQPNSSEDSLSNPPDVVPTGHAHGSPRAELSNDQQQQQSRTRYKQGSSSEGSGREHSAKQNPARGRRAPARGHISDVARLSKNIQRVSLDDKVKSATTTQNKNSQDASMLSIYPPVTSPLPTSTTGSNDKMAPSLAGQSTSDDSSLIPPLTKPHKSAPTMQTKAADTSQSKAKQADSTRTKRYSTQRQRPPQEMSGYMQESTRETSISQPAMPTQSAQLATGQGPICNPMPQYYGQLYARAPAVFRQPSPVGNQSSPHTLSFPQPPVIQPPLQAVPFSIPASSHVQSPPRLHLGPESTVATASMGGAVPPNGGQPLLQSPFVPAPVMNYGPPGQQAPPPQAPPHFQMTEHMPIQFPAPTQGPEPIQIHGGTTYFSHETPAFRTGTTYFSPEAQQASPSRSSVTRRPKAAIPIINPHDVNNAGMEQGVTQDDDQYTDEQNEYPQDGNNEVYLHADECDTACDNQSTNYHEPQSGDCDLTAVQDSRYPIADSETARPVDDPVASNKAGPVSKTVPVDDCLKRDSHSDVQQEASTRESPLAADDHDHGVAVPDQPADANGEKVDHHHKDEIDGRQQRADEASDPSTIIAMDPSGGARCGGGGETDLEGDDKRTVCAGDGTSNGQQVDTEDASTECHPSQGKETIMTEIKLVYTEAPES